MCSYTKRGGSLLIDGSPLRDKSGMATKSGHQALRKGRVSLSGQIYLLTTVTEGRISHYRELELARSACRVMLEQRVWGDANALC